MASSRSLLLPRVGGWPQAIGFSASPAYLRYEVGQARAPRPAETRIGLNAQHAADA